MQQLSLSHSLLLNAQHTTSTTTSYCLSPIDNRNFTRNLHTKQESIAFYSFAVFIECDAFDCSADALIKLLILADRSK